MARSNAAQSIAGSAALLRERMLKDFGIIPIGDSQPAAPNPDAISTVSGLDDEIDEWAALNKYNVFRTYQETQEKKKANKERQIRMREELEQQQKEFRQRQEMFKLDQAKYAKEQEARRMI